MNPPVDAPASSARTPRGVDGEPVEGGRQLLAAAGHEAGRVARHHDGLVGARRGGRPWSPARPTTVTRPASMAARAGWRLDARPRRTSSASRRRRTGGVAGSRVSRTTWLGPGAFFARRAFLAGGLLRRGLLGRSPSWRGRPCFAAAFLAVAVLAAAFFAGDFLAGAFLAAAFFAAAFLAVDVVVAAVGAAARPRRLVAVVDEPRRARSGVTCATSVAATSAKRCTRRSRSSRVARSSLPSWSSISLRTASITRSLLRRLRASSSSTLSCACSAWTAPARTRSRISSSARAWVSAVKVIPASRRRVSRSFSAMSAEVTAGRGRWQRVTAVGRTPAVPRAVSAADQRRQAGRRPTSGAGLDRQVGLVRSRR